MCRVCVKPPPVTDSVGRFRAANREGLRSTRDNTGGRAGPGECKRETFQFSAAKHIIHLCCQTYQYTCTAGKPIYSAIISSVHRYVRAYGGVASECLKDAPTSWEWIPRCLLRSPVGMEVQLDLLGTVYNQETVRKQGTLALAGRRRRLSDLGGRRCGRSPPTPAGPPPLSRPLPLQSLRHDVDRTSPTTHRQPLASDAGGPTHAAARRSRR
ncbi:hypothetical protein ZWY2020_034326 [Hordeum vulgare]|nr:hypothetical protein ZWY2020_034326 [Hordeum vulgare]